MNSLYDSRQLLKYLFIVAAVVIAIASVFVSDLLIKDLAREERQNMETVESGYFGIDELPVLAEEKNNKEQIAMCFSAYRDENWQVEFD